MWFRSTAAVLISRTCSPTRRNVSLRSNGPDWYISSARFRKTRWARSCATSCVHPLEPHKHCHAELIPGEGAMLEFGLSDRRTRPPRLNVLVAASVLFAGSVTAACGGSSGGSKEKAANATTTTAALSLPPP